MYCVNCGNLLNENDDACKNVAIQSKTNKTLTIKKL